VGLLTGCAEDLGKLGCDGVDCEPIAQTQDKLCPFDTHICQPRVGGGWDNVVRWKGDKNSAPDVCPKLASNISFWGNEVLPPEMPRDRLPAFVLGCGFEEPGECEEDPETGADFLCAPNVPNWPACVVANSERACPPAYTAQTLVGSDAPDDTQWTVCCDATRVGPAPK
jgi:hypothetical protein